MDPDDERFAEMISYNTVNGAGRRETYIIPPTRIKMSDM